MKKKIMEEKTKAANNIAGGNNTKAIPEMDSLRSAWVGAVKSMRDIALQAMPDWWKKSIKKLGTMLSKIKKKSM